ncbi:MAG: ABC transporter-related protein [Candidatus Woesebacteria bacterium GW2011_GWA1_39_21]|uniref:ABC transporter-related protein n=1 Tax=Candidatus Woesebacteria bacterium GW2011_GWA1_39_21 TaxID=1618550 RepID=A0A0G0N6U1_9BACT|nr:MAG: ABC transporter-related protein [Candidatus Woesebacteria bacterium GW2011_GWA1_39_21]
MKNITRIVKYTIKFWKLYAASSVFIVAVAVLSLVTPFLLKHVVDLIVSGLSGGQVDIKSVWLTLLLIIATDVGVTTLTSIGQYIGDILTVRLQSYLSNKFYEKLLVLDVSYYDKEQSGAIVSKLNRGTESITDFIQAMLNNFLPFFLTAFITIIILAKYSLFISVLLAVLFPVYVLISHKSTVAHIKFETKKNAIIDPAQGRMLEAISGIRIVRAFLGEKFEKDHFADSRLDIEGITAVQSKVWHVYDFWRRLLLNIILFGILAYIVILTFQGRYTLGDMTLLLQLVQQARFPLFAMSFILGQIQRADTGSKDFFEILETPVKITDKKSATELTENIYLKNKEIEFDNVGFRYEGKKKVLSGITFSVAQGEKLALVGESGQGKSTLVNLLLRYYKPQSGVIKVFGKDISAVTKKSLMKNVTVVFQESLLFSGTIYENIAYGRAGVAKAEVITAARAANAHDFVIKFQKKYSSLIGERGIKLSGGQKQRIAIARAILKDSPIVILDEATSSLDSRSEVLVQEGIKRLLKGRTSIIIAHRLSTIADADKVAVIEGGKVVQFGSPMNLLKDERGLYSRMVKLQKKLMSATSEEREAALKEYDLVA